MDTTSKTGEARKNRVFLIDDHPLVREGLVNLINSQRDEPFAARRRIRPER